MQFNYRLFHLWSSPKATVYQASGIDQKHCERNRGKNHLPLERRFRFLYSISEKTTRRFVSALQATFCLLEYDKLSSLGPYGVGWVESTGGLLGKDQHQQQPEAPAAQQHSMGGGFFLLLFFEFPCYISARKIQFVLCLKCFYLRETKLRDGKFRRSTHRSGVECLTKVFDGWIMDSNGKIHPRGFLCNSCMTYEWIGQI